MPFKSASKKGIKCRAAHPVRAQHLCFRPRLQRRDASPASASGPAQSEGMHALCWPIMRSILQPNRACIPKRPLPLSAPSRGEEDECSAGLLFLQDAWSGKRDKAIQE